MMHVAEHFNQIVLGAAVAACIFLLSKSASALVFSPSLIAGGSCTVICTYCLVPRVRWRATVLRMNTVSTR